MFTPIWERIPFWLIFCSKGLKQPTSMFFVVTHHTVTSSYKEIRWLYISYCKLTLESKVQHPHNAETDVLSGGFKHFLFSPRTLGKWSNLTNVFQMDWKHQLDVVYFSCDWYLPIELCVERLFFFKIWSDFFKVHVDVWHIFQAFGQNMSKIHKICIQFFASYILHHMCVFFTQPHHR